MGPPPSPLLRLEQVAEVLRVPVEEVRRRVEAGELAALRLPHRAGWRVRRGDLG